ncbi:hypothetical protein BATDEDRAFT_21588 [Batrachochytrium dendrobatidis JAM81]|uniref:Transmembrane adaptor Erv26 n=1 Tax=Batrachochytrium dendrobatidis (strain JAM81 / FGSC 10211) TaxID=684364 RepID=F4NU16_BATDJ|nr:uncharacterized protein BATDEDRAFT_21588 [Batrachochytrium dendrobatidis JAM81]EGF83968.1 hypothetical protein BATDEDRAFT_21588 [Batrachochytrium dendrobatidis JAM81]|eukprot:XP_006675327.1 hypothetical protein BATDEDRAFT_21588 [Batrachochytrium dendrobatidis JAM81]
MVDMKFSRTVLNHLFIPIHSYLASGLYFLAEFVEENTVLSKKIIGYAIWFYRPKLQAISDKMSCFHLYSQISVGSHMMLLMDGFPWTGVVFSLVCHAWYSTMLPSFPAIEATSVKFIISCLLAVADHFVWFFYFSSRHYSISEIGSFFAILVWMVPFLFFISLSANDYTLPAFDTKSISPHNVDESTKKKNNNFIKSIAKWISGVKETVAPSNVHKSH